MEQDAPQKTEQKTEITSLDLRFLVRELQKTLISGVFRKIYQYGKAGSKQLFFEIFVSGAGAQWLYMDAGKLFLTERKKAVPVEPPNFCMFLRKHLLGQKISNIRQHKFDRIVEIETKDNILILELFSQGNVILCDPSRTIIMPLEIQKWRDREVRSKTPYKYPPTGTDPFGLGADGFARLLPGQADKKIVAFLATTLGFGALYANEICLRASVDKDKACESMGGEEAARIYAVIEQLDSAKPSPVIYENAVAPFHLQVYKGKQEKPTKTFSAALDEFFSEQEIRAVMEEKVQAVEAVTQKTERVLERQEESVERWEKLAKESKEIADAIYSNYSLVEGVLSGINKAKDMDMPWEEIKQKITSEDTPEADAIKEIREGDKTVVIALSGRNVELDFTMSVEENAAKYYEDAKWAKRKLGGAAQAIEAQREKLEQVPKPEDVVLEEEEIPKKKPRKKWFEKFRWFISSTGFMVIGGKDATQNEMVIKKHAEPSDLVFHADIPGAAFVVIKSGGKEIDLETQKEAAEFAAAHSKAWSKGLGTVDIFSVRPEQVTKTPPSGEYLPKGAFMVRGERNWYKEVELKLAIGVRIDPEKDESKVIAGPVMSVRTHSRYFVTIEPGFRKPVELATSIKNKILIKVKPEDRFYVERIPLEDFQHFVPSGMGEIVEYA